MPAVPCPGGIPDAGGTKRGEKWFIRKLGVIGWLLRVKGWSCAASTCVRDMRWGHGVTVLDQPLARESCNLLPAARCWDLQGPTPLLWIRLRSGSARLRLASSLIPC